MARIEEALFSKITNDSSITNLLGDTTSVYPNHTERGLKPPYITYEMQSREPSLIKNASPTVDFVEIDYRIHARSFQNILDISENLRDLLDHFKGTVDSVDIDRIHLINTQDEYEEEGELHIREDTYRVRFYH